MSRLLDAVVHIRRSRFRAKIPRSLRTLGYKLLPEQRLAQKMWQAEYEEVIANARPAPLQTDVTLGIIKDFMLKYGKYEAACLELGVPYKLVSITSPDWIEQIEQSGCEAFLVWPSHINSVSKTLFDERLKILTEEMGKIVFPSYKALWLYESKRRTADWLTVNRIPHPETWVFYDREQAMAFLHEAALPLVFKTDLGSTASGVEIVRNNKQAARLVKLSFDNGYLPRRHDPRDRQWGFVIFQEYIPNAKEWRIVRIGDSYFGHQKLRRGEFHSGSREVGWNRPPDDLLDFCREVTEKGPFLSMNLDILETEQGKYVVNELHPLFGSKNPEQMILNGKAGRFVYDSRRNLWNFEQGHFCCNGCCNLRALTVLKLIGRPLQEPAQNTETAVKV